MRVDGLAENSNSRRTREDDVDEDETPKQQAEGVDLIVDGGAPRRIIHHHPLHFHRNHTHTLHSLLFLPPPFVL